MMERIETTGASNEPRKKITIEDIKRLKNILDHENINRRIFTAVEVREHPFIRGYFGMQNTIFIESIYPFVFHFEKDFDKAVDQCIEIAKSKVRTHIKNYGLTELTFPISLHEMIHSTPPFREPYDEYKERLEWHFSHYGMNVNYKITNPKA